jgi:predicted alpha-1,2-mannosidase
LIPIISYKIVYLAFTTNETMKYLNLFHSLFGALVCLGTATNAQVKVKPLKQTPLKLTQFVDPYIGTGGHGHVFLGASVPFGAVQLGPTNKSSGWDWCSGYHYSDSTIVGFSHTHLSGTGIGDLGDISFLPSIDNSNAVYTHDKETVRPGYYSVRMSPGQIFVELTASERVGFHRYTFPASDNAKISINLRQGIGWDRPTETFIKQVNDSTVSGYRFSKGWATDQRIYFTAIFSKRIEKFSASDSSALLSGTEFKGKNLVGTLSFKTKNSEQIQIRVGISPVSMENAAMNIKAEIPTWKFDEVVAKADDAWNKELSKLVVKTTKLKDKKNFYTALYHTMIAPSTFNDHNGDYRGTDKKVYKNASFTNLTTFSLWDTYRAAHPLYTIIQPKRVNDMINTMLAIYQQQGKLPVWHLMGNETNTMVGNPAITVVADAYLKGFKFDPELAFEAMKTTAMLDERGLNYVKKYGFIPADSTVESVAMGLEYSIADWSLAQVALKMKKMDDYNYFNKRGHNYQNYFDKTTNFMRGRVAADKWRTPFNPINSVHRNDDFTEGNAWQYTWLVPQDPAGLIKLMGGKVPFVNKLDSLFKIEGHLGADASPDISGLIGQYAHGNEPSHHITYLYAYANQPWKTAKHVRFILNNLYTDKPDGLSGNEDVGQMSSWYIFSALGFYPANPISGQYVFGSPLFDEATINLEDGKKFNVKVLNNSAENIYIQGMTLNGKPYNSVYLKHTTLTGGGSLIIRMGKQPSKTWGVK